MTCAGTWVAVWVSVVPFVTHSGLKVASRQRPIAIDPYRSNPLSQPLQRQNLTAPAAGGELWVGLHGRGGLGDGV
jgi:hypothetical protein